MIMAPAKDFHHGQIEIITVNWAVKTFQTFSLWTELLADVFSEIKLSFYVVTSYWFEILTIMADIMKTHSSVSQKIRMLHKINNKDN